MVKRARWLSEGAFRACRPAAASVCPTSSRTQGFTSTFNSATPSAGTATRPQERAVCFPPTRRYWTGREVPERVRPNPGRFCRFLLRLLQELAGWGFGADRSAGKGQFRLEGQLEPANALDGPADAGGCVVLSTFQPAADDPTDGAWDAFTKYGKLGPDFGLENVFKCPMILLRPARASGRRPRRDGWGRDPDARVARAGRREGAGGPRGRSGPLGFRAVRAAGLTYKRIEMAKTIVCSVGTSAAKKIGPPSH